jgi:alanine-glyoxylate transaminase/serine-glyoxylate transaminase/serine-pyruvate transaminase
MATPLIGHLDPQFIEIMDGVMVMLRQLFGTKNEVTFPVSATGSAGMETCFVNLLEPGDEALVCVNGVFGNRMCDNVERCGAKLIRVDAAWGQIIEQAQVKEALEGCSPKLVAIVHAETSTGVQQPLEEISKIVHDAGALLLVDAVTSLGGTDVRTDDWGIDAIYSGTQKCISAPPRCGSDGPKKDQGAELVSGLEHGEEILGRRQAGLSPYRTDLYGLCAV